MRAFQVGAGFPSSSRGGHFELCGRFFKSEAPEREVATEETPEEWSLLLRGASEA